MPDQQPEKSLPVTKRPTSVQEFREEVNRLFHDFFGETLPHWWRISESRLPFGVSPATDVAETEKEIKITAEVPGLNAEDISVSINDACVTIKGTKEEEKKDQKEGYFRQERSYGEFQRVIALPPYMANIDLAEASMKNGILTITIPKKAGAPKTREIAVKHAA
jgi:HSP20 family protein